MIIHSAQIFKIPGTLPGHGTYVGYAIYNILPTQWGWQPDPNATAWSATSDPQSYIQYFGFYGDNNAALTTVSLPSALSPQYEFAVYFIHKIPVAPFPIDIEGFLSVINPG